MFCDSVRANAVLFVGFLNGSHSFSSAVYHKL